MRQIKLAYKQTCSELYPEKLPSQRCCLLLSLCSMLLLMQLGGKKKKKLHVPIFGLFSG